MDSPFAVALVVLSAALVAVAAYGLVLLARIARGLGDLHDEVDDLKTRLGVLDPGETREAEAAPGAPPAGPVVTPERSPDETLPGSGG